MTKIVKRIVRFEPAEHPIGGVVGQRPERSPQCPPQRVVGLGRDQAARLRLIQPQPHERVRRGRHLLDRPRTLAHHRDQLLTGAGVAVAATEQLRRPRTRGDPERDQGPVTVREKLGEQVVELPVRDTVRRSLDMPRPAEPRSLVAEGLHWIMVGVRPPMTACQRKRVDHRPRPGLAVELVEPSQHALAMASCAGRILVARLGFSRHRVRDARISAGMLGLLGDPNPTGEVACLGSSGVVPRHVDRPQEPEPAQQVHAVRPLGQSRPPGRLQIPQPRRDQLDHLARRIK